MSGPVSPTPKTKTRKAVDKASIPPPTANETTGMAMNVLSTIHIQRPVRRHTQIRKTIGPTIWQVMMTMTNRCSPNLIRSVPPKPFSYTPVL